MMDKKAILEWIDANSFWTGLDPNEQEFPEEELVVSAIDIERQILTAQEGESNQQYANRKVKEYISGHSLSSGQEKLLFRVARWLEGPTIITEFPMKDAYPITAHEGVTCYKCKFFSDNDYDAGHCGHPDKCMAHEFVAGCTLGQPLPTTPPEEQYK